MVQEPREGGVPGWLRAHPLAARVFVWVIILGSLGVMAAPMAWKIGNGSVSPSASLLQGAGLVVIVLVAVLVARRRTQR